MPVFPANSPLVSEATFRYTWADDAHGIIVAALL